MVNGKKEQIIMGFELNYCIFLISFLIIFLGKNEKGALFAETRLQISARICVFLCAPRNVKQNIWKRCQLWLDFVIDLMRLL